MPINRIALCVGGRAFYYWTFFALFLRLNSCCRITWQIHVKGKQKWSINSIQSSISPLCSVRRQGLIGNGAEVAHTGKMSMSTRIVSAFYRAGACKTLLRPAMLASRLQYICMPLKELSPIFLNLASFLHACQCTICWCHFWLFNSKPQAEFIVEAQNVIFMPVRITYS